MSGGIVENVERAELHARDRHIEHADFSVAGDEVVHQAGNEAVREIAHDRGPGSSDKVGHLGGFLRAWIGMNLRQKFGSGSV